MLCLSSRNSIQDWAHFAWVPVVLLALIEEILIALPPVCICSIGASASKCCMIFKVCSITKPLAMQSALALLQLVKFPVRPWRYMFDLSSNVLLKGSMAVQNGKKTVIPKKKILARLTLEGRRGAPLLLSHA